MSKYPSLSSAFRRSMALAVVTGSAFAVAGAQSAPAAPHVTAATSPADLFPVPSANHQTPLISASDELSSSSSLSDVPDPADAAGNAASSSLATLEKGINLPGVNPQYGRRRYGAPRYRGSNTNGDGSEKYTAFAGVGLTIPTGDSSNYFNTSYSFQVGAGRNFNRHVGVNLQFDWDNFGLNGQTIGNYASIFGDPTNTTGFDAHAHIWSITANPVYNLRSGEGLGAYVVVGGGFYHKETTFTVPEEGLSEDGFGDIYEYEENAPVQNYSSNSAGVNGGLGLTYKFSKFANEKLYAEVRVVHTFNSYRPASTIFDDGTVSGYNFFPQNSETTTYVPIKVGIRF